MLGALEVTQLTSNLNKGRRWISIEKLPLCEPGHGLIAYYLIFSQFSKCRSLGNTCYLHFSGDSKPWETADWMDDEIYVEDFVKVMEEWYINIIRVCPKLITPMLSREYHNKTNFL